MSDEQSQLQGKEVTLTLRGSLQKLEDVIRTVVEVANNHEIRYQDTWLQQDPEALKILLQDKMGRKLRFQHKPADKMEEVIDGTMDYNEYVANTNETNKALKKEKSVYHVDHIEESKIGDLLCMFPSDFIMYERNRTVKVSDCKISANQYDWDYQDRMYNESFGGIENGSKL